MTESGCVASYSVKLIPLEVRESRGTDACQAGSLGKSTEPGNGLLIHGDAAFAGESLSRKSEERSM